MSNYAVVCLDETGSMQGQEQRVVTSLNEYVNQLPDDTHITVFKFDSERWTSFYDGVKPDWKQMEQGDYNPGAMTPLYDAVGKSIRHAEGLASAGDKVMVMVDTDGFENASKEHTQESVKALVDQKKGAGWEFLFMANALDHQKAVHVGYTGQAMGMQVNSASYGQRMAAYSYAASSTRSYFDKPDAKPDAWQVKPDKVEPFFPKNSAGR